VRAGLVRAPGSKAAPSNRLSGVSSRGSDAVTFKIDKNLVIAAEGDARCEDCGKIDELRPYGRNGANVCFDCAMKDEANAKEMFLKRLEGDS
jgi:hypothetical protein